jgi:TRAP-type mannitol/chloroaromatic compound transport system substrate-binding protein
MKRRAFIKNSLLTATMAAGISGCRELPKDPKLSEKKKTFHYNRGKSVKIKLATSWPANFPIMGEGIERFAQRLTHMSGGSIEVKVFPKNVLVPALGVFDATSSGAIDAYHSAAYYYKGKNEAFTLFTGFPFGMTANELNAWFDWGDGMKLWRELYAKYNLVPFKGGNTGVQMGGWFKKEIKSLKDLQGLKMRIPGLGGEVFAKLGVKPTLLPAGEIYVALERNVLDATEWLGPSLDTKMGFHKVAKHYYTGWHEPGSSLSLVFNKRKFDKLSDEQKLMIEVASNELNATMQSQFQYENAKELKTVLDAGVKIAPLPDDVLKAAKKAMLEVAAQKSAKSADFKKVWENAYAFLQEQKGWTDTGLKEYLEVRDGS